MDPASQSTGTGKYTVVARRYRPKTFAELVGQSTVSQALLNAIHTNRVGHAYLFTGARGVGKTSTARIFAKALNASANADGEFDVNSEVALAIDSGEDMDVIEIDGASNRGIDEIRQLRANASIRPSRSAYKIYIIDEVHMLTPQAFNALLKTLEEPPGHVKFIFCTTDPEKIPITVLSRCQRFDFPPVQTDQILGRLKFICENEGTHAEEAALQLIARRAAGSMRDSQSLLEQLLSFGGDHIRVDDVHAMLGTADETRLASFAQRMIERDAAGALKELDLAANEGVDVGLLAEQLLGYLRDMMAMTVGASSDLIRTANPNSVQQLKEWGQAWGTMSLLSALQLLDEAIVKMRHSVQSRVLLEVTLVQICQLQDLQALSELIKAFSTGQTAPAPRVAVSSPTATSSMAPVTPAPVAAKPTPVADDSKKKDELDESSLRVPKSPSKSAPLDPMPSPVRNEPTRSIDSPSRHASDAVAVEVHKADKALADGSNPSASPKENATVAKDGSSTGSTRQQMDGNRSAASIPLSSESERTSSTGSLTSRVEKSISPDSTGDVLASLQQAAQGLGGLIVQCVGMITRLEPIGKGKYKAYVAKEGSFAIDYFQTGENARRLSTALFEQSGIESQFEFQLTSESAPQTVATAAPEPAVEEFRPSVPQSQLIRNAMNHPLVKQFVDLFEGQVVRVDKAAIQRPHSSTVNNGIAAEQDVATDSVG